MKNTEVTDELERWSNPLTELTKVFSENQENIAITTFYESRSLHGMIVGIFYTFEHVQALTLVQVVPEASATMGWKDERCVRLEATHTSICRFTKTDPNWRRVQARLNVVAKRFGLSVGVPDMDGLMSNGDGEAEDKQLQHRLDGLGM